MHHLGHSVSFIMARVAFISLIRLKMSTSQLNFSFFILVMEESSRRRCQFIVKRKGRQCRMLVRPGKEFCGEHGVFEVDQREKRIFCPLDSTHSCYEAELSEHLKRCNASKVMKEVWYDLGINSSIGQPVSFSEVQNQVSIQLRNAIKFFIAE